MVRQGGRRATAEIAVLAVVLAVTAVSVWNWVPIKRVGGVVQTSEGGYRDLTEQLRGRQVSVSKAADRGNPAARIAVVEYSDFECPSCGQFATSSQPALLAQYVERGRVRWIFKHLPLSTIHPLAMTAAEAAICAQRQGLFWPMHDAIFAKQWEITAASLSHRAAEVGLNVDDYHACMASPGDQINRDRAEAAALGNKGTPTFAIVEVSAGGRGTILAGLAGAGAIQQLGKLLDQALQVAK